VPELGTPGSVRGVLSNGHPYRNPRPTPAVRPRARKGTRTRFLCFIAYQPNMRFAIAQLLNISMFRLQLVLVDK